MTAETVSQSLEQPKEIPIEKIIEEVKQLRELINGVGMPIDILKDETRFKILRECMPHFFGFIVRYGVVIFENDNYKLSVFENMSVEARNISSERDRDFLFASAQIGKLDDAFEMVEKDLVDQIHRGNRDSRVGFGL